MDQRVEVLPVTADEVMRILGLLNIEQVEEFLDNIKTLRKGKLFNKEYLVRSTQGLKENTINKIERVIE
jgi:hypothetical protein